MTKDKRNKIIAQVRRDRAARREAEKGLPQVRAHIALTHKLDIAAKVKNTVRIQEIY